MILKLIDNLYFRGEGTGKEEPFREWFGRIGEIRSLINCPALVITATASRSSRKRLKKKLGLINCHDIIESPDRENIKLFVEKIKVNEKICDSFSWLIEMIKDQGVNCPRHLIFCPSIKLCADVYCAFQICLDECICYVEMFHSCTTDEVKDSIRNDMAKENGQFRVVIATSAAGMGVNYQAVNNVVHYGPPKDLDGFIQQIGRAGRNGTQSYHVLIYNSRHLRKVDSDMLEYVKNIDVCRRQQLLSAYDSVPKKNFSKHLCCDLCAKQCKCNDDDCKSYTSLFMNYRFNSEYESSSESDDDLMSSSSSQTITDSESD